MPNINEKYPTIKYILDAYFHQDAGIECSNELEKLGIVFSADKVTAIFRSILSQENVEVTQKLSNELDEFLNQFTTREDQNAAISSMEPDWLLHEIVNINLLFKEVSEAIKHAQK